jgi:hypothetical protein
LINCEIFDAYARSLSIDPLKEGTKESHDAPKKKT